MGNPLDILGAPSCPGVAQKGVPPEGGSSRASPKGENVTLGEKGRVLPKALSALAPGGVVKDGEAATEHGLVAAKNFIGGADAGFEGLQVHFYARRAADAILIGNEQLAGSQRWRL